MNMQKFTRKRVSTESITRSCAESTGTADIPGFTPNFVVTCSIRDENQHAHTSKSVKMTRFCVKI
jgi:hypothetical protein